MYLVEVDILPFPCGRYIHHHSAVIIILSIAEASTRRNDLAEENSTVLVSVMPGNLC